MAIFLFHEKFAALVPEFRRLRQGMASLTGGSGAIPLRILDQVHDQVHVVMVRLEDLDQEFDRDAPTFANANAFLTSRPGGPQSVAAYRTAVAAIEAARPGLEAATLSALNAGAGSWIITDRVNADTGVTTAQFQRVTALPAGVGNAWRNHADVAAFRDALIAAGG